MVCYSDAWYLDTVHLNSGLVYKWWSEYQSDNQMVIRIHINFSTQNSGIAIASIKKYSNHSKAGLVYYSDDYC